jgi:hypothetical protein
MTRIVTYAHRYKRPPRKRKAVALDVPAVTRTKLRALAPPSSAEIVKPGKGRAGNDNQAAPLAPTIVRAKSKQHVGEDRPHPTMELPRSRPKPSDDSRPSELAEAKPVDRDAPDYRQMKAALARRLRGE